MQETPLSAAPSRSIAQYRHEHSYNEVATSQLFRKIEGGQAWFRLTQGTQGTDKTAYKMKMRAYHQDVILSCPNRIEAYVALHDKELKAYGSALLN